MNRGLSFLTFALGLVIPALGSGRAGSCQEQMIHLSEVKVLRVGNAHQSAVALGTRGKIYLLSSIGDRTRFQRSLDFGETFEDSISFTNLPGIERDHAIVADAEGRVYACRTATRVLPDRQALFLNASPNGGATWLGPDIQVNTDDRREAAIYAMAADEGDRFYIAWEEQSFSNPRNRSVWLRRSLDGGLSLEPEVIALWHEEVFEDATVIPWDLEVDGEGTVYVLLECVCPEFPDEQLFVQVSRDWGETWSGPSPVDPVIEGIVGPQLECGSDGKLYVAWTGMRNGERDAFFTRSLDFGETFEATRKLDPAGETLVDHTQMASDVGGNLYVSWQNESEVRVCVSHDEGVSWSEAMTISGSSFVWDRPEIASNESGRVVVLWQAIVGGSLGLVFNVSRDSGETWLSEPLRMDLDDPEDALVAPVVIDEAGRVYSVWEEDDPGSTTLDRIEFRAAYPTLGISLAPRDDGDGLLVIPPGGANIEIDIELRNHHPTDPITGLTAYLEAELPGGIPTGPLTNPRTFNIPLGGRRRGTLRKLFPGAREPGLYYAIVTTEGAIGDSVRLPILKR